MNSNSFTCEVVITTHSKSGASDEEDTVLRSFPCAPAFFGKAQVSHLRGNGGGIVQGLLLPPPSDDEFGCDTQIDMEHLDQNICPRSEFTDTVQIIRRGECSFMNKATNYRQAKGVVVINTHGPEELFVMAGELPQPGVEHDDGDDLPVSVMVSGNDGNRIIQLLAEENEEGVRLRAQIKMTKDGDEVTRFPHVNGSKSGLYALASNGWGVQMTPQEQNNGWQLFIIQHNNKRP
jgi:hypothetical protein